ncbi:hypothetical protein ACWEPC_30430 [Nonomuraea sp. NPDC004297]
MMAAIRDKMTMTHEAFLERLRRMAQHRHERWDTVPGLYGPEPGWVLDEAEQMLAYVNERAPLRLPCVGHLTGSTQERHGGWPARRGSAGQRGPFRGATGATMAPKSSAITAESCRDTRRWRVWFLIMAVVMPAAAAG